MTPQELFSFGQSHKIQEIKSLLVEVSSNPDVVKISSQQANAIRNFVMFMMTVANGLRSSNLKNITMYDYHHMVCTHPSISLLLADCVIL